MGFYRIERHKEFVSNFLVAHALCYQFKYFVFAFADAQPLQFRIVQNKNRTNGNDFPTGKF